MFCASAAVKRLVNSQNAGGFEEMDAEGFAGFGSPVASPGCLNIATPDDLHGYSKQMMREDLNSPLLFRRTPGVNGTDSSKK